MKKKLNLQTEGQQKIVENESHKLQLCLIWIYYLSYNIFLF